MFDLDSSSVVRSLIGLFISQMQAGIQLSCNVSNWPFRFLKHSGIQSISASSRNGGILEVA